MYLMCVFGLSTHACVIWLQVEEFGMHLNVDGTVLYGLRVEAIDDSSHDNVSVDKLSRMLVRYTSASTGWTHVGLVLGRSSKVATVCVLLGGRASGLDAYPG